MTSSFLFKNFWSFNLEEASPTSTLNQLFGHAFSHPKEEQENTNDKIFNRLKSLYDSQLLTKKEFFEALKENNIYKLQAKASEVDEYSQEQQENIDKLELAND